MHSETSAQTISEPQRTIRKRGPLRSTPHSLTEQDAAQYIGLSIAFLRVGRAKARGPAYIRAGRAIRYRVADLDAWLNRHRVETSDTRAEAGR